MNPPSPSPWWSTHVIKIMAVLSLVVYVAVYSYGSFGQPIRSDGAGYYAYLPSLFLYGNLSFEELAVDHYEGAIPPWTGIRRIKGDGAYLNRYSLGSAVLMSPFFLAGHLLASILPGQDPPGYSFIYQHAAGLAGLCYMVLGLVLLRKVLLRSVTAPVAALTLYALILGSNLLNYGSGDTVNSHAYSFFLFCALLYLVPAWHSAPGSISKTVLLGAVAGLIPMVRVPNAIALLLIPLYGLTGLKETRSHLVKQGSQWKSYLLLGLVALAVFSPQLLYWKSASGQWLVNSYGVQGEGFNLGRPEIMNVLFSIKKGLFFYAPILVFMIPGLWLMRKRMAEYWLPVILVLLLHLYLVASWFQWWFGGSFGHRAFVEYHSILALPLAAFFSAASGWKIKWPLVLAALICAVYTMFFMVLYYTREIPIEGLDGPAFFDIFWSRKETLLDLFR